MANTITRWNPRVATMKIQNPIGEEGFNILSRQNGNIPSYLTRVDEMYEIMCNHRHNGDFCMDPIDESRDLYKCRICGSVIDLQTMYDPKIAKELINYFDLIHNSIKSKNFGFIPDDVMYDLALAMITMHKMPDMLEQVNRNYSKTVNPYNTQQVVSNPNYMTLRTAANVITGNNNPAFLPPQPPMLDPQYQAQQYPCGAVEQGNPFAYSGPPQYAPQQQVQMQNTQGGRWVYLPDAPTVQPTNVTPPAASGTVTPEIALPNQAQQPPQQQPQKQPEGKPAKVFSS